MSRWALVMALLLSGCKTEWSDTKMTNEDIRREAKACKDAGLGVSELRLATGEIYKIQCEPEKTP